MKAVDSIENRPASMKTKPHRSHRSCRPLVAVVMLVGALVQGPGWSAGAELAVPDNKLLEGLQFRQVGPFRGGRSTTVTGHPDLPFTYLMGTSGGGLWRTTNAGTSWENLSDGFFGSASIGSVEYAPSDRNVIYVGTGSGCPRGNIINGDGVYRSLDSGESWSHVGLPNAGLVPRIVVHPRNPEVVYAAVLGNIFEANEERGVYRSVDGGDSWQRVLFVSDRTGAVDLAINPANPRILYAAMWTAERKPWTLVDGSDEGGLWKSVDGGDSWNQLEAGLPKGPLGRIGLALSPARPERVWAHVTAPLGKGGIFRSDDAGGSWQRVNSERKLQVRGWYYSHLEAHPRDANTVFSIGLRFWRSIDGGKNFESISTPHGDNHDLWIDPQRPEVMVEASDGGGTVTLDGGSTWSTLHNQPTAELYRLTVDRGFPFRLYAAQQDNTSISVPAWSEGGFSQEQDWWMAGGGESGHIAVHPDRPDIVYSGNYIGLLERWDRSTGERRGVLLYPELADGVPPRDLRYRFQWNAPIRLSPHDPLVLYHTSHQVHRSRDEGMSWETLSGDLSYDDEEKQALPGGPIQFDDTGVEVYSTIFAFEESPLVQGELWAGTDDGRVHISRDNGSSWNEVTPKDMQRDTTVNTIELSGTAAGRAYVVGQRYRLGDESPLIWRTDNYGQSWRLISTANGLDEGLSVRVVREHPDRPELLVAGTERALYSSLNGGDSWQPLQLNLPVVQVSDLAFVEGSLAVATHGRSFWVLDDIAPLVQWTEAVEGSLHHLFQPTAAFRSSRGRGYSMGSQPDPKPGGAQIFVWLGARDDEQNDNSESDLVAGFRGQGWLRIRDVDGELVRESKLVAGVELESEDEADGFVLEPGLNRLTWDFFGERPEVIKSAIMSLGYTGPNRWPPGEYQVEIELQEEPDEEAVDAAEKPPIVLGAPLQVLADPRTGQDVEGARAAFELAERAKDGLVEIHRAVSSLRSVREQLQALEDRLEKASTGLTQPAQISELRGLVDEKAQGLLDSMSQLEEKLIQTKSEAPQDGLNFPPRLDNQYSFLYGQLVGTSSRPNDGAYQRLEDLEARWRPLAEQWRGLVSGPMQEINALLSEAKLGVLMAPDSSVLRP